MSQSFLIELGCEEIPARFIETLLADMSKQIQDRLHIARITFDTTTVQTFATYRRLAVRISGLSEKQRDGEDVFSGPPLAIAKNDAGDWLPAAQGFAKKVGLSVSDLDGCVGKDAKGRDVLYYKKILKGADTVSVLPQLIHEALSAMSLPVAMRWGEHTTPFFRPVHWLVVLYGETLVPVNFFDVSSGVSSRGHRFLSQAADGSIDGAKIDIRSPEAYEHLLQSVSVCVDAEKRREIIVRFLKQHDQTQIDDSLLSEVVYLVEQPCPLI
jgi:glycyl-tRNA synthetase beta chain